MRGKRCVVVVPSPCGFVIVCLYVCVCACRGFVVVVVLCCTLSEHRLAMRGPYDKNNSGRTTHRVHTAHPLRNVECSTANGGCGHAPLCHLVETGVTELTSRTNVYPKILMALDEKTMNLFKILLTR